VYLFKYWEREVITVQSAFVEIGAFLYLGVHFANSKCGSVYNQVCIACCIANQTKESSLITGSENIQQVLDKNDNAKLSRFRGSVDISGIIFILYFILWLRQVFVLSETLELIA